MYTKTIEPAKVVIRSAIRFCTLSARRRAFAASRRCLDQVRQGQRAEVGQILLAHVEGAHERLLVAPEAELEHGKCRLGVRHAGSLAAFGAIASHLFGGRARLLLPSPPRNEEEISGSREPHHTRVSRRRRDLPSLQKMALGSREPASLYLVPAEIVQCHGQRREGSLLASEQHPPVRENMLGVVVQQLTCGDAAEHQPAKALLRRKLLAPEQVDRPAQRRCRSAVPIDDAGSEPFEERSCHGLL
jgi:hypothetical protein